jgi:MFS family permease
MHNPARRLFSERTRAPSENIDGSTICRSDIGGYRATTRLSLNKDDADKPAAAVSTRFVLAYTIVQIATFAAYAPVLSILLPLKLQMLDAGRKGIALSYVLLAGAVTASIVNITAGALSDRTAGPFGRRRPWLMAGAVGLVISYGVIYASASVAVLILGIILMQTALNCVFSPLTALLADKVPDRQKGMVAGFLSLGPSLGTALGAGLIGGALHTPLLRFVALALIVISTIAPFAIWLKDRPIQRTTTSQQTLDGIAPWRVPNFALLWITRFLVQCAIATTIGYLLFYIEDVLGEHQKAAGRVALLIGISMVAGLLAGPLCGALSDRLAARQRFLFGGAAGISVALALLALALNWSFTMVASALLGAGLGCFSATDSALAAQVIPSLRHAGRDLGLLNLANALPQAATPLLALLIFSAIPGERMRYALLFGVFAALCLIGGTLALFIRLPHQTAEPTDAP